MQNARLMLVVVAAGAVVATALAGIFTEFTWALMVAVAGVTVVVLLAAYIQIKTLQTVAQRLTGLQKQQRRLSVELESLQRRVSATAVSQDGDANDGSLRGGGTGLTPAEAREVLKGLRGLHDGVSDLDEHSAQQLLELRRMRAQLSRQELREAFQDLDGVEFTRD